MVSIKDTYYTVNLLIPLLFVLGTSQLLKGQQADTLSFTLNQAKAYAMENSPEMKNARLDIAIAEKKIWEYKSGGLPQLSATANYQHIFAVPEMNFSVPFLYGSPVYQDSGQVNYYDYKMAYLENPIQLGTSDNLTLDMNATHLIFSGSFFVGLKTAKIYKELTEQTAQKTAMALEENISKTYLAVLISQENENIISASLENLTATRLEMEKILATGFIEETAVDQLVLNEQTLKNLILTLSRQKKLASDLLKIQMGLLLESEIKLTENLEGFILYLNLENLLTENYSPEQNINYKLLDKQEELLLKQVKLAQATCMPNIAAFYRHQEQAEKPEFNFNPPDVVGITMNIPLFSSGGRWSKIQQSKLEYEKARHTKESVTQSLTLEFLQAKSDISTYIDKYQNSKKSMELAGKIYDRTLIKFKEGMSTSTELTQTHTQYLTNQQNYFLAIYELLTAKVKYDRILNKGI